MNDNHLQNLTRQELYERIWAIPATKLAEELGISDVAIAKRCKKLGVPQPPRGYWAKLAAGQAPMKPPLPPVPKTESAIAATSLYEPNVAVSILTSTKNLIPVASQVLKLLQSASPNSDNQVLCHGPTVPYVIVSVPLIERATKALHAILEGVAARGVYFRTLRSSFEQAYLERENNKLYLSIEEPVVTKKRQVTEEEKRHPKSEWKTKTRELSGTLIFLYTATIIAENTMP